MSETITIFEHTTASGSLTPALVAARGAFVRATNLPANWGKARLAIVCSLRGATATDSPVTELIAASENLLQQVQVGFSNGAGMPGTAGVLFVGSGTQYNGQPVAVGYDASSGWNPFTQSTTGNYAYCSTRYATGTTVVQQTSTAKYTACGAKTPLATTDFCFGRVVEIDVATAGSVSAGQEVLTSFSPASSADVGVALEKLMLATISAGSALTGGWWSNSVPVGCTHLFVRLPFVNNRLVVHGYKVAQVG